MLFSLPDWTVTNVETDKHYCRIYARYDIPAVACKHCRSPNIRSRGYKSVLFMDIRHEEKPTGIEVSRQQLQCRNCSKYFSQPLPDIDDKRDMTKRLVEKIIEEAGKNTFASVAGNFALAENTVKDVFMKYAAECEANYQLVVPKYLGVDELHFKSGYRCVMMQLEGVPKIFQILIDRKKRRLPTYSGLCQSTDKVPRTMWSKPSSSICIKITGTRHMAICQERASSSIKIIF